MTTLLNIFPTFFQWVVDSLLKSMSKKAFPNIPESWGFEPVNSTLVSVPLIGGQLYPHMESGFAEPVPEVAGIRGPSSVELKSGRVLDDIDTIIYCTGYDISIPVKFEPVELDPYPYPGALPNLYRNIFSLSPDPAVRNSVAFLGQVAAPFPGFAQYESIAMAVSQIWLGKSALPPLSEMQQWRRDFVAWREATAKKYGVSSTFYPVFVPMANYLIWLDECAGLGIKKRLGLIERWTNLETWSLWWNDRKLYNQVLTGLCSPAIFRLFDEGKRKPWAGAREQIFLDNDAINRAQRERKKGMA
jgi:dimethylaniline monooxygenase (N-oxide forming)